MYYPLSLVFMGLIVISSQADEMSALSEQASQLKSGMTRSEVLRLLGPADFAVSQGDSGDLADELREFSPGTSLELWWKNGRCEPVQAQFGSSGRLTGWSEGRALCLDEEYDFLPSDAYSCEKPSKQNLCEAS